MGRRNIVVVSSSDEGDEDFSLTSISSNPKSKRRHSSVPRANPQREKKARISYSCSRLSKGHNPFDDIKKFCEGFDEGLTQFKVPIGCGKSNNDLWVDRYRPRSLEELAVHKKKVEEVKLWFEERLKTSREEFRNNVLLITGQAGVGKSATVHVVASHLGANVCEWNTPTPTIWQEHMHNSYPGIHYKSKLEEFENFVEKIRKYGMIDSSKSGSSHMSTILLIDDLPVANGKVANQRLQGCLHLLVRSACVPTVILITEYGTTDCININARSREELQQSLQGAGACKVVFNPITLSSIKKVLSKICIKEHHKVTAEQIDLIAKASGGDIRHAITSLQYFCLKKHQPLYLSSNVAATYSKESSDETKNLDGLSLSFGRDETLSLFHALGKFLHNKRESENLTPLDAFGLRERFRRLPLKMDAPEKVLCQAHGQARPIADFLHENVIDFVNEEAIDDAWVVASYLSDADILLASLGGMVSRNYEAENVVQSAAASVAARGVLFGNFHPSPSRWHAIRRPQLWQVEQSLWHNKIAMNQQRVSDSEHSLCNPSVYATEWKPVLKWLGYRAHESLELLQAPRKGYVTEEDGDMDLDDEIEDW